MSTQRKKPLIEQVNKNKHALLTDIYSDQMAGNEQLGFNSLFFSMFALPSRDPRTTALSKKMDNGGEIHIQSAKGVPWGRDVVTLHWMTTLAVKFNSPRVEGLEIKKDYLDALGYSDSGKIYRDLKSSMERWLSFRSTVFSPQDGNQDKGIAVSVLKSYSLSPRKPDISYFEMDLGYYTLIQEKKIVVLPWKVVAYFKNNPFTLSFLDWLSQRMLRVQNTVRIPVKSLYPSFGSEYKLQRQFKSKLVQTLAKIKVIWPGLNAHIEGGLLILNPSPSLIPRLTE